MRQTKTAETILFGILLLFFLQVLSDFIESIYAFGLLVTAFTIQIASIVLLFTPLILLFFRKTPGRFVLLSLIYVALLGRLLEPDLDPGGKLVACAVSMGAFMLVFPLLLKTKKEIHGSGLVGGLTLAVMASVFLRTANSGLDLSESGWFQGIAWALAILAAILAWRADFGMDAASTAESASSGRVTGLAVGLAAVILMIYFALASPTVISRWTGYSYPVIVTVLVVTFMLFVYLLASRRLTSMLKRYFVLGWNLFFILTIVLTILPHQIAFPVQSAAYPLDAPDISPLAVIPLLLMLVSSPVLVIDFMLFARGISAERPTIRQLGGSFALAALFLLVMVFFHVFTSIYDYAPVVGPFFRDRFWLVYLLAGLGVGLPLLLLQEESFDAGKFNLAGSFITVSIGTIALLTTGILYLKPLTPSATPSSNGLKVMTYNIQQGYDKAGNKNLEGQLAVIQRVNPDVLGLQESDIARIADGNADAVRYFADHLGMYSYYGPTTTAGTFGIALLSKFPIQNPRTFFMYSTGEQTAAIHAEITAEGKTYQVFVTHLGNGGPLVQLQDVLSRVGGLEHVILMGDFNFEPTAEQYAMISPAMTPALADSWLVKWPDGKEIPGFSASHRIDYIFVSPGTNVTDSEYVPDPDSDHPYLYAVIGSQ